jgi:hypothetical protein
LELTEPEKLQQTRNCSSAELNSLSLHTHKAESAKSRKQTKRREFYGSSEQQYNILVPDNKVSKHRIIQGK